MKLVGGEYMGVDECGDGDEDSDDDRARRWGGATSS